MLRIPSRLAA